MAGKGNSNGKEQRRQPRVDFFSKVKVIDKESNSAQEVFAANVSRGGIFLRSNRPLPRGKQVELEFDLDDGPVKVDVGEVVWTKPFEPVSVDGSLPGMGVQFKNMPNDSRRRIESFINDVLEEPDAGPGEEPLQVAGEATDDAGLPADIVQLERKTTPLPSPGPAETAQPLATPPPARVATPPDPVPALSPPRESTTATMKIDLATVKGNQEREDKMATFSTPPAPRKRLLVFVLFVLAVAVVTFVVLLAVNPFGKDRQRQPAGSSVKAVAARPAATTSQPAPDRAMPADAGAGSGQQPAEQATGPGPGSGSGSGSAAAASTPAGKTPAPGTETGKTTGQTDAVQPPARQPTSPQPDTPASSGPPLFSRKPDGWRMILAVSGPVTLKHFTLKDPPRLAVDVKGASYSGKVRTFQQPTGFVTRVRVGPHEDFVRYVLDFTGSQVPPFRLVKKARTVEIVFPGS